MKIVTEKNFVYKDNQVKVVRNVEASNNAKRISTVFLIFMGILFFATSSTGITGSVVGSTEIEFTFFPIAMGFISLVAAFLTYGLIEK